MGDDSLDDQTLVSPPLATEPTVALSADATLAGADATLAGPESGREQRRSQPGRARGPVGRGTAIGRYLILSTLGAGGMGVVYAAYDPELDRKVALKLLRADGVGTSASEGRTRLLREAQALAKLAHPNVVAIHDVGTHGDEVFLAMEFVDGRPLGDWAKQATRTWREKLAAVVEAGRGVAAAHAAGLLHRDLKPDNIMVAADGRVRVMDLGLARAQAHGDASADEPAGDTTASPELAALALPVTQAGAIMGTPAYMAPEQFHGIEVGTAADQFALCVTAWELLAGARPFSGDTLMELAAKVLTGERSPAPRGTDTPRWVWPILERGLAAEPAQRWPSIDALLLALDRGHARARGRRVLAGVAVLALLGAGAEGVRRYDVAQRVAACEAAGQAILTESWDDATQDELRAGLLATGVASAPTVVDKTLPWLDAQATAWAEARTGACMDAEVHGTWSADLLDRATWCLDERRLEFEALVTELTAADATTIYKATTAATGLRPIDPCRDADRLARLPPPPTDRAGATEVRTALARARALNAAGKYADGLAVAEPALDQARALAWPPLVADAGYEVGSLLGRAGRPEQAEAALADAYFEAVKSGTTDTAADAATGLVFTLGYQRAEHDEGQAWARHADAALVVLGEPEDGLRRATLFNNLATVDWATGAYDEAKALHQRALAIREAALGPTHPTVASSLNNLALVHDVTGAYAEAEALHQRALAIREAALGPDHPEVAASLTNLALVAGVTGAYEEAKALHQRALGIREAALGPDHPSVGDSLGNLALVHHALGAYAEAKALYERSLAIHEAALGPEHPTVAVSLTNLAVAHFDTGTYAEAKALHERALSLREAALGPEHPEVATSLSNLAGVHLAMASRDQAKALYERALAIQTAALGPEHPYLADPLTGLAEIALAQARPADAIPLAERAVQIRVAADAPAEELAASRFVLARALWDGDRDHARARALATEAREGYAAAAGKADQLAEVDAWLTAHADTP